MTARKVIGMSGVASANALARVGYRWTNARQIDDASAPDELIVAAPLGVRRKPALVTPSSNRSEYIHPSSITWWTAAQSSGYGPFGIPGATSLISRTPSKWLKTIADRVS